MATMVGVLYFGSFLLVWFICSHVVRALAKKMAIHGTGAQRTLPSPPALPIIGHLHHLLGSSTSFPKKLHSLATHYGPLLHLRLGTSTSILVSNADFAKEILKTQELNFIDRPEFGSSDYNIYNGSEFILAPYGTYWRFLKKLCMTRLLSNSTLNQFIDIREQEILKLLEYLVKVSREKQFCDLGSPLLTMMNNVICRMAMSTKPWDNAEEADKIKKMIEELAVVGGKLSSGHVLGPLGKFDLLGYGRRLKKELEKFDRLVEEIMKKHEENSGRSQGKDLMDIIMETCNDPSCEVKLTRKDIKAFFLDMFMAGTETSSIAVKWAMGELINHPQVFEKLRDEISSVTGGGGGRLVKESDVQNLPYLHAVVRETLRLHPPSVILFRQSNENCKIGGFHLKSKTRIMLNLYSIMRDPNSWNNPDEFIPERFMGNSSSKELMEMKGLNFDYLPFGSGRRACPGASLALAMLHSTVAALVQCFDWKIKGGEMVDMREASGLAATLAMANPFVCYPIAQFHPF